jgi:hypothetical protein
MKCPGRKEECV